MSPALTLTLKKVIRLDINEIRDLMKKGATIYNLPLRMTYYGRVSTEKDEQLNSLANQQIFYDDFIKNNKNWIFSGGYIDEGISGITASKRDSFLRMIEDAKAKKFDVIITKEISRFARNTLDSIRYTRELLNYGVAVWFQNDNINTLEVDSELRLTIMSAIAQDEVRRLSSRIKFGHSQSIKNGVVMGNSLIYGYDKDKGKLVINKPEAEMIRLIFNLYASGEYTTPKLEKLLAEKGFRNRKGDLISRGVVNHIIINPKYKGYYCGNKVKIEDMFTKKQNFLPEEEWVMYKDEEGLTVPAIVDEATWERANEFFRMRSEAIKGRRTSIKPDNLFTGKIICSEHNVPFYLKARTIRGRQDNTWVCSHRIKNGKDSCRTYGIKESELTEMLTEIIAELSSSVEDVIGRYIQYVKKAFMNTDYSKRIGDIESEIKTTDKRKSKLLELFSEDIISKLEYKKQNNALNEKIKLLEKELSELTDKQDSAQNIVGDILKFKAELVKYASMEKPVLTPVIINRLIDRILVTVDKDETMRLQFCLKTGTQAQKTVSRSGYMFNTILPERRTKEFLRMTGMVNMPPLAVNYTYSVALAQ